MAKKGEDGGFDAKFENFDIGLKKLEDIVEMLDRGELNLEESISTFEEGMSLVKALIKKLEEAERKIEVLKETGNGAIEIEDFEEED